MASKPANGAIINGSDAAGLSTGLVAVWAMLEGSTSASADLTGNGHDLTLDGTVSWTTINGDPALHFAGGSTTPFKPAALASGIAITGGATNDWSIAWRAKQTSAGTAGMVYGNVSSTLYGWMENATGVVHNASTTFNTAPMNTAGEFTADHDFLLTSDHTTQNLKLYCDGTLIQTINRGTSLTFDTLGAGYTSASFALVGTMTYCYVWSRTLSLTDARAMAEFYSTPGNPYEFLSSAAGFTISPTAIPKNHSGNITLTLSGTGTSWNNSTSVFTPSGVTGVTKVSQNVTSTTAATVVVTTDATHTGTLTITESVTGTATATTTIGTATLALGTTTGATGTTPSITLTGTNTVWTQETASGLFTVSGGTGASIATPTGITDTGATAVLTVGSATGTLTITDTSTGATATFTAALPSTTITLNTSNTGHTSTAGMFVQTEGFNWAFSTYGSQANSWGASAACQDCAVRFKATTGQLEVWVYCVGQGVCLTIDSSTVTEIHTTLPNTSAWAWVTVGSSLDSAAEHVYLLSWGSAGYIQKIRTTGGSGINTADLAPRQVLACYGDSITQDIHYSPIDATYGWVHLAGVGLNMAVVNRGVSSSPVYDAGTSQPRPGENTGSVTDITNLSPAANIIVILYGINDEGNGYDPATLFEPAYLLMLQRLRAGNASALIVCEQLLRAGTNQTTYNSSVGPYNTQIQAAITAVADARIIYASGMYNGYDGADGIHPNQYATPDQLPSIAAGLVADINAASASFTATVSTIPANHSGQIAIPLVGSGTTWTSGSTVTITNSLTGTTTVTKDNWARSSNTAAVLTVHAGAGTGTFKITVDGVDVTTTMTVATASFALDVSSGAVGTTPTLTLTPTHDCWYDDVAVFSTFTTANLFTVSGGAGASLGTATIGANNASTASVVLTVGSAAGTLTITDNSTGATTTFTATVASFTALPSTIPTGHSGNIVLTLTGTNTAWTSGTVFSITNATKVTQSVNAGAQTATLTITTSGAATAVISNSTDAATANVTVATATLALSPTSGAISTTPSLTITGGNTLWTTEVASGLFTVSGGTGASIATPTGITDTGATAVLTVGSATGTLTITDTSTGATATFTATATPVASAYTLTNASPTSAAIGNLSNNFTVAPTTYNWPADVVITPTTDGSGIFTPVSVSPTGSSSATFKYTPLAAGSGTHSIGVTNNKGMTNPSPVNFTVTGTYILPPPIYVIAGGQYGNASNLLTPSGSGGGGHGGVGLGL